MKKMAEALVVLGVAATFVVTESAEAVVNIQNIGAGARSMALGNVLSRPADHPIVMTARTIPPGTADLTNDLSDDHPIGFRYDRALSNRARMNI